MDGGIDKVWGDFRKTRTRSRVWFKDYWPADDCFILVRRRRLWCKVGGKCSHLAPVPRAMNFPWHDWQVVGRTAE